MPEALKRAREVIMGHVAALRETGQPVPDEDTPARLTVVEVDDLPLAGD